MPIERTAPPIAPSPQTPLDLNEVRRDPKRANLLYHDVAAPGYDRKWAISFDDRGTGYIRQRARRMLPRHRYGRVLEMGAGTGFMLLNLWRADYVRQAHATDISPGMLAAAVENARILGCDLRVRTGDAERLPYEDGTFDLIIGHAFLHHLPRPELAFAEAYRVAAAGGAVWFAGEPTKRGDRMARTVGRHTWNAVRAARRRLGREEMGTPWYDLPDDEQLMRSLEWNVDLHTFDPQDLAAMARAAGFENVRVETEEFLSSLMGWAIRTFEAAMPAGALGERWGRFAYAVYRTLYRLDQRVLYGLVPKDAFYNVLLYGEKRG